MPHEHWELELGYDEIKTEMLDQRECIRSTSPERVEQELLGILLAYNLIRLEMAHVARQAGVSPTRISFAATLEMMTAEWYFMARMTAGAIPARLRTLDDSTNAVATTGAQARPFISARREDQDEQLLLPFWP